MNIYTHPSLEHTLHTSCIYTAYSHREGSVRGPIRIAVEPDMLAEQLHSLQVKTAAAGYREQVKESVLSKNRTFT